MAEAERRRAEVMMHTKGGDGGVGVAMRGKEVELTRNEKENNQEEDEEDEQLSSSTDEMTDSK